MNFKEESVIELLEGDKEISQEDFTAMKLAIFGVPVLPVVVQAPKSWRTCHMGAVEMGG